MFDVKYLKIFFDRNENFENRLDRNKSATNTIRDILFNIENEFLKKRPEFELMVKVEILRLLVVAIRGYDYVNAHQKAERHLSMGLHNNQENRKSSRAAVARDTINALIG